MLDIRALNNVAVRFLKWRGDFPLMAVRDKNNLAKKLTFLLSLLYEEHLLLQVQQLPVPLLLHLLLLSSLLQTALNLTLSNVRRA